MDRPSNYDLDVSTWSHALGNTHPRSLHHIDVIQKKGLVWTIGHLTIQELCAAQTTLPEVIIVLLPAENFLIQKGLDKLLSKKFNIPACFWTSVLQEASGFIGSQKTRNISREVESFDTFFRFLIKEPVKGQASWTKAVGKISTSYIWHRVGFFTSWLPSNTSAILSFDTPLQLRTALLALVNSNANEVRSTDPFTIHALLLERIIEIYNTALWSFRDTVRDLEKNRVTLEDPQPDYVGMHEIARHIIHSSETLGIAIETVASIVNEHKTFFDENTSPQITLAIFNETTRRFRFQENLLKGLLLRSKALEERLRSEINLSFNLVAQYDSRLAVRISEAARVDSAAMKTISILGLVFLPGTFICAIFSTSFFNFSPGNNAEPQRWTVSEKFWIYWLVTIPVTIAISGFWFYWQRRYVNRL